MVDKPTNKND
ncbi:hypothetical protein R5R35_003722 [Gryllus longicercus]|uniref:Uncharacterized protein n=1 Tax=Gryllus longicercus TaxID=2509291 RepID=A0AAN9VY52_9ORTH